MGNWTVINNLASIELPLPPILTHYNLSFTKQPERSFTNANIILYLPLAKSSPRAPYHYQTEPKLLRVTWPLPICPSLFPPPCPHTFPFNILWLCRFLNILSRPCSLSLPSETPRLFFAYLLHTHRNCLFASLFKKVNSDRERTVSCLLVILQPITKQTINKDLLN